MKGSSDSPGLKDSFNHWPWESMAKPVSPKRRRVVSAGTVMNCLQEADFRLQNLYHNVR